jgi:hypothetical protein
MRKNTMLALMLLLLAISIGGLLGVLRLWSIAG